MTMDLSRVDWRMFSIAVRVRMVSAQVDDEGTARAAAVSIGSVKRARCGLNVSDMAFNRLCLWLEQEPKEFFVVSAGANPSPASQGSAGASRSDGAPASPDNALPASGLLERGLPSVGSFDR